MINKQVGRLKQLFRWAAENELVPPSLYHGLQAVAGLQRGRSGKPSKSPMIDVDVEAGTIRIGTTVYSESRPVAAYFRAHMKANGERISAPKALKMEPKELKGLRIDRLKIKSSRLRQLLDTNVQGTRLLWDQIALE